LKASIQESTSYSCLNSLEQAINERDANSFENASETHMMDDRIGSSSGQRETNAFSLEIGSSNVKDFSLEDDTVHS